MRQYRTDYTITKQPVDPQRVRTMPAQFGAMDRRLVYQKHIRRMSVEQIALYVFLQCVSDAQGLSFYSDDRVCDELHLSSARYGRPVRRCCRTDSCCTAGRSINC